ncbi:N-6 DNA methylase [Salinispirillum marinum]|uniref:N-6 DNA methylase n=2 Tax=Saccharospirillaceae TaxID=255527 RepID=A0ABV8BDN0_9GAMM
MVSLVETEKSKAQEIMKQHAVQLVKDVIEKTESAQNEYQLQHEIELSFKELSRNLNGIWKPCPIQRRVPDGKGGYKWVDSAHGAVIIEYEGPKSFNKKNNGKCKHGKRQAEEYAQLLHRDEGRELSDYTMVAWDGESIAFGRHDTSGVPVWETLQAFDEKAATRLIKELINNGTPLVSAILLKEVVGPDSKYGQQLIPMFFDAIVLADAGGTSKEKLLYTEWNRLFGQVVGIQPDGMRNLIERQSAHHDAEYTKNISAYLFSLNTYIALLAKIVAACALPGSTQNILNTTIDVQERINSMETGKLFKNAGISNMYAGDFFSWYLEDDNWTQFAKVIDDLLVELSIVDFEISKKRPESTRDLFKGIYEGFVPRELRHALGEFYTPDWLAEHGLDVIEWDLESDLLDPTCGSGTFLLEAIRRRRVAKPGADAVELLSGLYGIDLNPLAVLSAKGSIVTFIAPYLNPQNPVTIPVYMADAINTANIHPDGCYEYNLLTDKGEKLFRVPEKLILDDQFYAVFQQLKLWIMDDLPASKISEHLLKMVASLNLNKIEETALNNAVNTLVELHKEGWDGIWCSILAERFRAGSISPVKFICGNPPWVKWSHLPRAYVKAVNDKCRSMGVFSSDKWVGGIESDISTVITFEAIRKYLKDGGRLGFFITGTVFSNESSEGFRRFKIDEGRINCAVTLVEDYNAIKPFDGVSNFPTLLVVERGENTRYPITYKKWSAKNAKNKTIRSFSDASDFREQAESENLFAKPAPGGKNDSRPWLIATKKEHKVFKYVFNEGKSHYVARKGITTDRHAIFWVDILDKQMTNGNVTIRNRVQEGRTKGIPEITDVVEAEHIFPMLRGKDVTKFRAVPTPFHSLVPQREMHGDPDLPFDYPNTYQFLEQFKEQLKVRSSLKRFQQNKPYYSLWSTGQYTFSPYKVLWREMNNKTFFAAYIGPVEDEILGTKVVVPDHKLYFIPVETEDHAAFLTGFLNSTYVAKAVMAYGSLLSLGSSVAEYLKIPEFDDMDSVHLAISEIARIATMSGGDISEEEQQELDDLVNEVLGIK